MKNLFYLILLVLPTLSIAQNSVAIDTTAANLLYSQSITSYEKGEFKKAEDLAKQAIEAYQEKLGEKSNAIAEAWYQVGRCQSNKGDFSASIQSFENVLKTKSQDYSVFDIIKNYGDMVYSYGRLDDVKNQTKILDVAIQLAKDSLGQDDETLAPLYVYKAGILTDVEQFVEAFSYLQMASAIAEVKMKDNPEKLAQVESAFAGYHYKKGDFQKAADRVEKIVKVLKENGGSSSANLALSYGNIAACYQELRNLDEALLYHQKGLSIFEKIGDRASIPIIESNHSIGECLSKSGRYDEAMPYLEKTREIIINKLSVNHPLISVNEDKTARCLFGKKEYNKAIVLFESARKKYIDDLGENVLEAFKMDLQIGNCYTKLKQYAKAEEHYNRATEIIEKIGFRPGFTELNTAIGNFYSAQNEIEKADEAFEKALQTFDYDANTGFIKGSRYEHYLDALLATAQLKFQAYKATNNARYLEETLELTRRVRKFIIHLKSIARTSIPILIQSYKWIYEGNIKVLMEQEKLNLREDASEEIFQVMEEAKDNLILLAFQETKAKSYKGLSQKELDEENDMKTTIAYFETKIYEEQSQEHPKDSIIKSLNEKLFSVKTDYKNRLKALEKNNPVYFNLKYNQKLPTLKEIQGYLNSEQVLIEFFVSDHTIYILTLSDSQSDSYAVKIEGDLAAQIQELRKGLYNYWLLPEEERKPANYDYYNELYVKNSCTLYQLLLEPLSELPQSLIIVPDDILSYIPFEVLLTEKPVEASSFQSHNYLGSKHQISYNYSAALWKEMRAKSYPNQDLLAFAPSFSEEGVVWTNPDEYRRSNLSPLFFNVKEIEGIQELVGGTIKTKEKATSDFFFSDASKYGILHFATHAKVEDRNTDFSYLAFYDSKDSLVRDKVYLRDLYNMDLQAQMVVLSACETGIGKLQKGEGMISLARGFAYSGTKSIITSLWEANDQASSDLMILFYQNIKKGMTKDAALQQAKNTYISNATSHRDAHPVNWATFVAIGDMEALNMGSFLSLNRVAILLAILTALIFFYFFLKKR